MGANIVCGLGGKMKRIISVFLICLFLLPLVLADGMIIEPRGYVLERGQIAYITYNEETNLQKMIVGIQVDSIHGQKAAWIFPVPAPAGDVAIDVLPNMPSYYGREVKSYARSVVDNIAQRVLIYQIWPVILFMPHYVFGGIQNIASSKMMDASVESGQSVVVYEHIEKYGVTTELVGAVDNRAIKTYLTNKGLDVPFEAYRILDNYNGKGYTFVVSWLNQPEFNPDPIEYIAETPASSGSIDRSSPYYPQYRQLGVQVMFKTEKPYFPLLPTSIYGSEKVPATIFISDYYTPVVPDGIKGFTKTSYMKTSESYYPTRGIYYDGFDSGSTPNEYTVVSINDVPSKFMTDDMWFEKGSPSDVGYASSLVNNFERNQGWKAWFLVIALSLAIGSLLGFVIFREQWWKLTLVSLANALTIIGMIVALFFVKTKNVDPNLRQRIKQAGLVTVSRDFMRKFIFMLSFTILFVVITFLIGYIVKLPLS
jgi:hypothetical protein